MKKVAVVGPGKVGTAMAVLLQEEGYDLVGVAGSNRDSVQTAANRLKVVGTIEPWEITKRADIVFITTPDRVIEEVCGAIQSGGGFRSGQVAVHMSGALAAGALQKAKEAGVHILALHPLQSFADLEQAIKNLPGSFFSIEGDDEAIPVGKEIVQTVQGQYFLLDSAQKPLYHMGAAVASNFLVAVLHWAIRTYQQLGMTEADASKAIWPLVLGSINNVAGLGPVGALTGPISRGDVSTIDKHLSALKDQQPENVSLYKALGSYTANIAMEKGTINNKTFEQMLEIFEGGTN